MGKNGILWSFNSAKFGKNLKKNVLHDANSTQEFHRQHGVLIVHNTTPAALLQESPKRSKEKFAKSIDFYQFLPVLALHTLFVL